MEKNKSIDTIDNMLIAAWSRKTHDFLTRELLYECVLVKNKRRKWWQLWKPKYLSEFRFRKIGKPLKFNRCKSLK